MYKKLFSVMLCVVFCIVSFSIPIYADESVTYTFDYEDLYALYVGGYLSGGTVSTYGTLIQSSSSAGSGYFSYFTLSSTSTSLLPYIIFDVSDYNSSASLTKVSADVGISYVTGISSSSSIYYFQEFSTGSGSLYGYLYSTNSYNDSADALSLVSSYSPLYTRTSHSSDIIASSSSNGISYISLVSYTSDDSTVTFADLDLSDDYIAIAYGWSISPAALAVIYNVSSVTLTFTTDSTDALLNQINQNLINSYETLLDINQSIENGTSDITSSISISTETIVNKISDLEAFLTEPTDDNTDAIDEMQASEDDALQKFDDYITAEDEALSQDDIDSASDNADLIFDEADSTISNFADDILGDSVFTAYMSFFSLDNFGYSIFAPFILVVIGLWVASYVLYGKGR